MRLYEPLSYMSNNNNNNNHANDNNIDRMNSNGLHSNGNTVKTFTSNGNHQSNIDSVTVASPNNSTATVQTATYFERNDLVGSDELNEKQNWHLDTLEFGKIAALPLNETYCFYGSHRKLKLRESNPAAEDDKANGNNNNSNCNGNNNNNGNDLNVDDESNSKDTIDLIDDSSSDIEAEINRLINRSNLCRQQFECESHTKAAPTTEDQFMDEEGNGFCSAFLLRHQFRFFFFVCFFLLFGCVRQLCFVIVQMELCE